MEEALRTAKGLLPVRVVDPLPLPIRLLVPDDLSESLIILFDKALWLLLLLCEEFGLEPAFDLLVPLVLLLDILDDLVLELDSLLKVLGDPLGDSSGCKKASNLNCSML